MGEQVEHFLAYLFGIVPILKDIAWREIVPDLIEVFHQLVRVLIGFELLGHLGQGGSLQHIDDQH